MVGWLIGMLVAAGLTILGAIYLVNNVLAPRDATDPLKTNGGLAPTQDIGKK
jgi:hypothetical protein